MKGIICVDFIDHKSIFVGETGEIFFSNKMYEIGESEKKDYLKNINILPLKQQLEIKNTL